MSVSRQKKKLNDHNPRKRNPSGIDKTTMFLSIAAVLLLVLVVLFMNHNFVESLFPGNTPAVRNIVTPEIERIDNSGAQENPEEPLVNLGVPEQTVESPQDNPPEETPEDATEVNATARLFFIRVSDEGKIIIKSVLRPVPSSGSPLSISIRTLLEGPRPNELSNDILSLIPEGSRLIGARIEGGVAFLDFNEQFRFNALGIEGYKSQVEQIVYTATEFPTVRKVQFLVEGQRIEYLGGEGFWVGGPLGREDF